MEINLNFRVTIGGIEISPGTNGYLWMSGKDGEGMQVEESKLADCLQQFYKDNF